MSNVWLSCLHAWNNLICSCADYTWFQRRLQHSLPRVICNSQAYACKQMHGLSISATQSSRSPCLAGLATNLLEKVRQNNDTMHVHNRTAAKADPLLKQGATWASSPASIGKQCSITFSCVFSDTALREVFTDYLSGHPRQDSLYIDCSTVSPDTIRELDAKAKAAGDHHQSCNDLK